MGLASDQVRAYCYLAGLITMAKKGESVTTEQPTDSHPPAGDEIVLIAMHRKNVTDSGPDTADVHPDEIENWRVHGWEIDPLADGFEIHDPNS